MKTTGLILLAAALRSPSAGAQALRGAFGTPDTTKGFERFFLRFEGQRFFYKSFSCTGTREGSGTFSLAHHVLYLRFERSAADTAIAVQPGRPTDPASTFRFRVLMQADNQFIAIPGVVISSRRGSAGVSTDQNGEALLQYHAPKTDTLEVFDVGFERIYLPVRAQVNQQFTIRLSSTYYFAAGTVLKLRIRKQTPQTLQLEESFDFADPELLAFRRFQVHRLAEAEAAAFLRP